MGSLSALSATKSKNARIGAKVECIEKVTYEKKRFTIQEGDKGKVTKVFESDSDEDDKVEVEWTKTESNRAPGEKVLVEWKKLKLISSRSNASSGKKKKSSP